MAARRQVGFLGVHSENKRERGVIGQTDGVGTQCGRLVKSPPASLPTENLPILSADSHWRE